MLSILRTLAVAAIAIPMSGCGGFPSDPPTVPTQTAQYIKVRPVGIVVDRDGVPVSGATVHCFGAQSATTGSDGRFSLPVVQTVDGATITVSASCELCVSSSAASAPVTPMQTEVQFEVKVTRMYQLPIDGSETATLRLNDPPAQAGDWYPVSSWQTRYYKFSTPIDADVSVELSWEHSGNAALMLWAFNGDHTSEPTGDRQVIKLRRNSSGTLYVVQPLEAGVLTEPVRFTLETKAIR